ncbi:TIGR03749 family integrating conjugative element protein [Cedecea neteri]|nr:TIGR03749 family integrating conjugative element protein [Cedecea neteri]
MTMLVLACLASASTQADELMKWERIPLQIPLSTAHERVVFVDKNVRVGFPPALNGKLRVQSTGGAVYLKAETAFPTTRLQLQDVETGEVILLDVTAAETGPDEPVRLVYSGDVTRLDSKADLREAGAKAGTGSATSGATGASGATGSAATPPKKTHYSAPLPVVLTRYAAQSLYAPLRTVEAVPGIHPLNPHLPGHITTLYPAEPVAATPLATWSVGPRAVVALQVRNTQTRRLVLDPRLLQGEFVAATFQHRWLGPAGTPEDTTVLYLVTAGRPETAFIAEPVVAHPRVKKGAKP